MKDMKHKTDEEMLNRIIAAAYKDAGFIERFKIHLLSKKDPEVKRIFDEYKATAESVKNIPLDKCPDSVINSIKIKNEKITFVFRPAFVLTVSIIIITIAIALIMFQNKKEEPVYTKAEIELAEEQVKTSLAIVNKVFKKTEALIQDEVMPKRVGKPINKSLKIINDVLIGG